MLMESPERAREVLQRIRSSGVRISMDDFGTGYSNLAYITQLPVDEVKIDQSLVRDLGQSAEAEMLMRGMIVLFERLGLKLVAEGIETAAQRDFLIRAGCTNGQGFLLGPPASPEQLFRRADA
jgi:EAL domain-containing protein (putative c-di-GMP-specific phosphodiesterase class I)